MLIAVTLSLFVSSGVLWLLLKSLSKPLPPAHETAVNGISIVIPFRNEADHFPRLIETLMQQSCTVPYEVILIDDNSEDNFDETLMPLLANYPDKRITVLTLALDPLSPLSSKQQALDFGVAHAQFDWLLFTDADMFYDENWLATLITSAEELGASFVFGRTSIETSSLFSFLQNIQLQFLFTVGWLFSTSRLDSSCMGNNILLKKELYDMIGGQEGIGYSIVEDQALLKALRAKGVTPLPSEPFHALASTYPEQKLSGYFHQLLRWSRGGATGSPMLFFAMALLGGYLALIPLAIVHASLLFLALPTLLLSIYLIRGYSGIGALKQIITVPILIIWLFIEAVLMLPFIFFVKPVWKGRKLS